MYTADVFLILSCQSCIIYVNVFPQNERNGQKYSLQFDQHSFNMQLLNKSINTSTKGHSGLSVCKKVILFCPKGRRPRSERRRFPVQSKIVVHKKYVQGGLQAQTFKLLLVAPSVWLMKPQKVRWLKQPWAIDLDYSFKH